jgi:3-hydroxybutyryl-CoA dehydrogenase
MHFFNPAPLMPLVEIVHGLATDPEVVETLHATATAWGKTAVRAASTPGFIVNRCARPYYAEALRLYAERAADPATLDAVMRECGGFRMGPFELMDMIGHDVNFAVTRSVWEACFHDPRFTPSVHQQELVNAGFFGRKSGRGFYDYAPGAAKPTPTAEAEQDAPAKVVVHGNLGPAAALAERMAARGLGVERRDANAAFPGGAVEVAGAWVALSDGRTATARAAAAGVRDLVLFDLALDYSAATRIPVARAEGCDDAAFDAAVGALQAAGFSVSRVDDVAGLPVVRTVAMLANEAADAVQQGIASPSDVDAAMQLGVGYPRGPLAWADAIGVGRVRDVLAHLAAHYGESRYRVAPRIARRALSGSRLAD